MKKATKGFTTITAKKQKPTPLEPVPKRETSNKKVKSVEKKEKTIKKKNYVIS